MPNSQNIHFTAGNSIVLLPGFEVKNSAVFSAEIADCIQQQFLANQAIGQQQIQEKNAYKNLSVAQENGTTKTIIYRLNEPGEVLLQLKNAKGNVIVTLSEGFQETWGHKLSIYQPKNSKRKV